MSETSEKFKLEPFKAVSMTAVMDRSRLIAVNNEIPWNIPEDFNFFQELVKKTNSICLIGRVAYERALKYRSIQNSRIIILSNTLMPAIKRTDTQTIHYVNDIQSAHKLSESLKMNLMIGGGFKIYNEFADLATNFHVTLVDRPYAPITGSELRFPFCPQHESKDWIIVDIKQIAKGVSYYHFARSLSRT